MTRPSSAKIAAATALTSLKGSCSVSGPTKHPFEFADPMLYFPTPLLACEDRSQSLPTWKRGGRTSPSLRTSRAPILSDLVVAPTCNAAHHSSLLKDSRLLAVPSTKQIGKLLQHSSHLASGNLLSYYPVEKDSSPASRPSLEAVNEGRKFSSQRNIHECVPDLDKDFSHRQHLRLDCR